MSLNNLKNNEASTTTASPINSEFIPVRVFSVILDSTHPKYSGEDSIGTIFYGKVSLNESSSNLDTLNRARPIFSFIKYYPLIGEIVLILNTTSRNIYSDIGGDGSFISTYYLPNINIWNNPHHNVLPLSSGLKNTANSQEASLGLQQNGVESTKVNLGEYFKENESIKNLQPFEGDMILEGRFGNSLRFGSSTPKGKNNWSENDSEGDPITIISNGQPNVNGDAILENINDIDSSIFMLSNQNINNFVPASLNLQSLGTTLAPTPNPQILIVDTPDPPVVVSPPEPALETPEPIINETPPIQTPPTEEEVVSQSVIDDPIFALLDEAKAEGEIDFTEISIFDVAGTEPDDGDENPVEFSPENPPNWVEENRKIVEDTPIPSPSPTAPTAPAITRSVSLRNKSGNLLIIPPPDPNLTVSRTNRRNIKYIFLHTAASSTTATPVSIMEFFFRPDDPSEEGFQGRGWNFGGYHWILSRNGDATRIYSDNVITNGAKGYNGVSIHLNWIGGASSLDMTQPQAYTMARLLRKYLAAYPNAKVIGHNQVAEKACPWFYAPQFAKNIGINPKQIDNRNIIGMNLDKAIQNANTISNGI